jgi:hypothetical protein
MPAFNRPGDASEHAGGKTGQRDVENIPGLGDRPILPH